MARTNKSVKYFLPIAIHEAGIFAVESKQSLHAHIDDTAGEVTRRHDTWTEQIMRINSYGSSIHKKYFLKNNNMLFA